MARLTGTEGLSIGMRSLSIMAYLPGIKAADEGGVKAIEAEAGLPPPDVGAMGSRWSFGRPLAQGVGVE
jgi:hypothetical protein